MQFDYVLNVPSEYVFQLYREQFRENRETTCFKQVVASSNKKLRMNSNDEMGKFPDPFPNKYFMKGKSFSFIVFTKM